MQFMCVEDAVQLMKREYVATPALALTPWQAQRLWNLPEELCDRALRRLVGAAFLVQTTDGTYTRRDARVSAPRESLDR